MLNKALGYFQLGWEDFGKGLVMVVISAVLTSFYEYFTNGTVIVWSNVESVAAAAAIAYLLKNLGTNSQGKFLGKVG